jgi:hypothetical protein
MRKVFIERDLRPKGLPDGDASFGIVVPGQEWPLWAGYGHGFATLRLMSGLLQVP